MDRQVETLLSQLRNLVAAKLNELAESISLDRPVLWYGFDSLACMELGFAFEEACGFALPLEDVLAGASIRDVVSILGESAGARDASGSSDGGLAPLTPQEKALWIDHQLDPSGSAYNLARAFWTETDTTLAKDFQRLADRFAALRTTVSEHNGEPFLHCLPAVDDNVVDIDAAGWPIDALRARAVVEAERPFTPGHPLWRVVAFRTEDRTLALFAIHHLIADMQSLTAIASSFGLPERARRIASLTRPPQPGVTNFVPGEKTEMLDGFWEGQLDEWPAPVQIPADFPSSPERGRGGQIRVETGRASRQAITDLAHRLHCTAFPPLLAAYAALIHRWTGQRDFAIGCPVSLRSGPAADNDRGYRVSPLPIRLQIPEAATYSQLVRSVRDTANGVIAHREMSLLAVKKGIGNASPFNAMFVYHPGGGSEQDLSALVAERDGARFRLGNRACQVFALPHTTCLGGLRMEAVECGGGYQLTLEYSTDRFREETMLTFANSFNILLGRMLASPDTPIVDHPLTSPEERLQLTIGCNSTRTKYPDRLPVPEAIRRQAARTPSAVAVEFEDASLSYAALESHSNRLARRLRALGAARETFVGVAMERSIELPVVLLAIMKTGAAYVPLDPHGPPERLRETSRDANILIRITHNRFAGDLQGCVTVEADDWDGCTGDSRPLGLAVESESAAYLIYTSGSTGRPKGVVNTHSGLANRLHWMQDEFRIGSGDAVLQKTPLTFDVSVWELFWPLMNGARLVLAKPGGHRDSEYLCRIIRRHCITVVHFVPSMLSEFLNYPETARLPSLRHVVLSGEELKRDVALRCMTTIGARLSNLYGPTEAAIDVSCHVCSREERGRVPIGRPIANVELYILDQAMEPVPTGMVGHLYIGGAGLSRGYHGQPRLTASCFVPNPFGTPGSRLYRTGDLARRQAGGAIEYMGRLDRQVKVGGVRIELGELEIAAMEHPNIASAYARLIRRASADRLGCYLVPRRAPGPGLAELREFLARRLAPAMLPSWTMDVEAAAFSSSGKLDPCALPEPVLTQDAACGDFEPRDSIEEQLLGICAEVLERDRCDPDLSFSDQGGSSLDAIRVASRMRTELGCVVPLDVLLGARPLSAIRAEVSRATPFEQPIPPPGPVERPAQIPLSYEQERLWFMDQLLPHSTGYVVVQGVGIEGALDAARVRQALGALLERHEILRTTFSDRKGQPTQRLHATGMLDFENIEGNSNTVQEQVRILGQTPFVLSRLPLARFRLVRLAEGEHVLLVAMHHIITDGWTFGILLRDFLEHYAAEPDKRPVLQYSDYALWQRKYLTEKALEERLAYWRQTLAGARPASIPADRRRPAVQSFAGRELRQTLSPQTVSRLESAARSQSATMFMAMLGAFAVLLSRYNNETDISVAIPAANRPHPALERAVGFFANTLVCRIDLTGDPSFEQVLARVRKVALEAFHHSEAPFEKVVEAIQPGRDLSMPPLIQSMFVYQNAPLPRMSYRDFRLRRLSFDAGVVRYDMRLSIEPDGDRLEAAFQFNSDLYTPGTMERAARHFEVLLNALAADPARRVSELPLQTEQEKTYWRDTWNDTRASPPRRRLEELFLESAARHPEAIALTAGTVRMSYGELAARINRLAHLLSERAVGRGELVAVVMEKGWEQVVAVLGVLRAGAAYLPIDAGVPTKRLETLLLDGRVRIALTQANLLHELEWGERLQPIAVDSIDVSIEGRSPPSGDDLDLAYVIYTSGSTGLPKGVMITHRAAVNTLLDVNHRFRVGPRDRVLAISSLSFDLSVWDVFGVLAAGGTIVLPENRTLSDPRHWISLIETEGITIWNSVPALARMLIASVGPGITLPTLRLALLSGDWIPLSLPADLGRLAPMAEMISLGGATEASIWSIFYPVKQVDPEWRSIPYGRPMANQRVYVLDRHFELCPPGISGRIWIGGDGVAAGYWNNPENTAARFVKHPASGERLYNTGDLGRYHPGGYVELLGREDLQLKVGGFRIEPGEVEAALLTHPSVQSCVVTAQRPHQGEPVLVAFVVSKGRPAGSAELQAHLSGLLPHYLVPSAIGFLDALPLSPNGKTDLKALPLARQAVAGDVWPRNRMEQLVAGVLSEVMEGAEVVMDRNFFELGATSLSLVRAQRLLESRIGRELPVIDLFRHSTVRALAAHLEFEDGEPRCGTGRNKPCGVAAQCDAESERTVRFGAADIAITGMAGRFPGAATTAEFWSLLQDGVESVRPFSPDQREAGPFQTPPHPDALLVLAAGVLEGIEWFDAEFFGMPPREAEITDPQQRLLLECAWEALEDAGYRPDRPPGAVGVYAGCGANLYLLNLLSSSGLEVDPRQLLMANEKDYLATRIAYRLGLTGPCMTVQTACSSSLVAVHLAAQSLRNCECDVALAGGVSLRIPQRGGYYWVPGGIDSRDGHCRAFDQDATGTVSGSGLGLVVMRRREDAVRDRDHVRAIIRGTAVNNDGSRRAGFTAPSAQGQAAVIAEALAVADVSASEVGYLEAHGTGTALGDAVELAGLSEVFPDPIDPTEVCLLGSVKTNIGHLDAAAGVAGLIKTTMALERDLIPPSLHFLTPNPGLKLHSTPFRIPTRPAPWPGGEQRIRVAGVSSFGIGGTNAHVVVEKAPAIARSASRRNWHLLPLSARSEAALASASARLAAWLNSNDDLDLQDVAFTLQTGRVEFPFRRVLLARDTREAATGLLDQTGRVARRAENAVAVRCAFPQAFGPLSVADREALAAEQGFRQAWEQCRTIAGEAAIGSLPDAFLLQWSLAKLWMHWGVNPAAFEGHGVGALVARCLARELPLDRALQIARTERNEANIRFFRSDRDIAASVLEQELRISLGEPGSVDYQLAFVLGQLWICGAVAMPNRLYEQDSPRRVSLPAYPFERKRHWIGFQAAEAKPAPRPVVHDIERGLARIWQDVLGGEPAAPSDDFFDLGGDSLLATQVLSRIANLFGCTLPADDFFENPTIAGLAALLRRSSQAIADPAGPRLVARPPGTPRVASFAQQRLWFMDQLEPGNTAFNITLAIAIKGHLDTGALQQALDRIFQRHEVLRTRFRMESGVPVPVTADSVSVPIEFHDLLRLATADRRRELEVVLRKEALRSFNLEQGPLAVTRLVWVDDKEHVLIVSVHHVVFDVWSATVFFRELSELYLATRDGRASPLAPLALQYADFAAWQRETYEGGHMAKAASYWTSRLAGVTPVTVPPDFPDARARDSAGACETTTINEPLARMVKQRAASLGVTPFMILIAGYAIMVGHRSGARDFAIGTDIANRNHAGTEPLIGFFVNQLALRIDLARDLDSSALIGQVRATALEAFAHQDFPFDRLVEALKLPRSSSRSTVFGAKFVMRNVRMPKVEIEGLSFEPISPQRYATTFGFVLTAVEDGECLGLGLDYSTHLYKRSTIADFLSDYLVVLERVCDAGEATLAQIHALLDTRVAARLQAASRSSSFGIDSIVASKRRAVSLAAGETRGRDSD